ncbi:Protein HIT1 [Candida viswanathii]|uniref:Protein HIT1 n=1 Tax=Candida viswanathii TaxID=5486 RepID=A0A367Y1R7_9ASCO|nr:Protein HIT1 [Candida viswanathii]
MICGICETQESKYKCPKCSIAYCSIACYKSPDHSHENITTTTPTTTTKPELKIPNVQEHDKFGRILQDIEIRYFLKEPSLQIHLLTIIKILNDPSFTQKNLTIEQKQDVANLKINDLRTGGVEENKLVEEFIQRVLYLIYTTQD